ncbi:unnamed protein product [Natator depressus]
MAASSATSGCDSRCQRLLPTSWPQPRGPCWTSLRTMPACCRPCTLIAGVQLSGHCGQQPVPWPSSPLGT